MNACQTQRPRPLPQNGSPTHLIRISEAGDIDTAGLKNLTSARKRGIYTLALLGTPNVDTRKFARLYGDGVEDPNPTKTFTQAIGALKKSMQYVNHVRLSQPYQAQVSGIKFETCATPETLETRLAFLR